jgi:hypothetical protein
MGVNLWSKERDTDLYGMEIVKLVLQCPSPVFTPTMQKMFYWSYSDVDHFEMCGYLLLSCKEKLMIWFSTFESAEFRSHLEQFLSTFIFKTNAKVMCAP